MEAVFAAAIIVVLIYVVIRVLVKYSDIPAMVSSLLTALVLFTVILSVFLILNGSKSRSGAVVEKVKPASEISDEEVFAVVLEQYKQAVSDFKNAGNSQADAQVSAAELIKERYGFTDEEWRAFMKDSGYLETSIK
jgi:predicted PurR-regulated permease PerM